MAIVKEYNVQCTTQRTNKPQTIKHHRIVEMIIPIRCKETIVQSSSYNGDMQFCSRVFIYMT